MIDEPFPVLVTGAAGFAGRHLVNLLLQTTAWTVVGLTRQTLTSDVDRLDWRQVDLRDQQQVAAVVEAVRPRLIFHLAAALPPAADSELLTTNSLAAAYLCEAAATLKPSPAILLVGSDAQYGPQSSLPTAEDAPLRPLNVYGRSKVLQEAIGRRYAAMLGLRVVCVRPFNHIGPGQSDRFVVASLARQIALAEVGQGPAVIQLGRSDSGRDFTDVRDVVAAYLTCLLYGESGDVYNIGSGRIWRIGEVAALLAGLARVSITFATAAERVRDHEVMVTQCDASRLRRLTGWTPGIPMEQTLHDTLDDWRRRVSIPLDGISSGSLS